MASNPSLIPPPVPPLTENPYVYHATVLDVHDGDTCRMAIDVGFNLSFTTHIRLLGINTPELYGPEAQKAANARDYLSSLILGKTVIVHTIKDKQEKYGRYLATIFVQIGNSWLNVNDDMINKGWAVPFMVQSLTPD